MHCYNGPLDAQHLVSHQSGVSTIFSLLHLYTSIFEDAKMSNETPVVGCHKMSVKTPNAA